VVDVGMLTASITLQVAGVSGVGSLACFLRSSDCSMDCDVFMFNSRQCSFIAGEIVSACFLQLGGQGKFFSVLSRTNPGLRPGMGHNASPLGRNA